MSFGPLPADLAAHTAEDFERVIRPNVRRRNHRPVPARPEPAPEQVLRVRRLTWTAAALAESDEPVGAAGIRAWDAVRSLALLDERACKRTRRFGLPGPIHRLLGSNSR